MRATIRLFRDADAEPLAEWLDALAPAEDLYTAVSLLHQRRALPTRRRPLWLVAVQHGKLVGLGRDEPQIFGNHPGLRRIWVGVRPDLRCHGLGSQLWQAIEAHARTTGAVAFRSWALADLPASEQFLVARGFSQVRREKQSWVDPSLLDTRALDRAGTSARERGFRVVSLAELLPHAEPALRRLFLAADRGAPGHAAAAPPLAASTFRRFILGNPILDQGCSTVVMHAEEPVALCWLKGDLRLGRYAIEFTGTAPDWRGQGLATLAKLSALHLAAKVGVRWIGTANDETNAPMLAINRRLGHSPLADLVVYEHSVA